MTKKIAYIGIKALPANAGVDTVVEKIVGRLDRTRYAPTVYLNRALVPAGVTIHSQLPRIGGNSAATTSG